MSERIYALIRVGKGDYLLPGNDGRSVWRIGRETEEGESGGVVSFWAVHRWTGRLDEVDPDWSYLWRYQEGGFRSRSEAIAEVVRLSQESGAGD